MTAQNLDQKDLLLLKALRKNARASLVSLARDIGLSRSATHDRIVKLEEHGVITSYTIKVDRKVLPLVRAFLTLRFSTGAAQNEMAAKIHDIPGVEAAYCLSGDIDMFVYCECETVDDLSQLRDGLSRFDGVIEITTRNILVTSGS